MKTASLIATFTLSVGCASSGGFAPVKRSNPFPDRAALAKIEAEPAPTGVFEKIDDIRVPYWQLAGPLPDTIGPVPRTAQNAVDKLAVSVAAKVKNAVASEPMACLAHQLGEFYLAYGGAPEKSLRRFMEHRCGVTSQVTSASWRYWDKGELTWAEADKDNQTSGPGIEALEELAVFPNPELGAWFGSNSERTVAMFVAGARSVDLKPLKMAAIGGQFEVEGTLYATGVEIVGGAVNLGSYRAQPCHALEAKLPAFRIRCDAEAADFEAGFEIYTMQKGDLVASSHLWQRVWPSGELPNRFVLGQQPELTMDPAVPEEGAEEVPAAALEFAAPLEPEAFDTAPAGIRSRMLERINALRAAGNLKPVTLAEKQSEVATQVSPHYWGAHKDGQREKRQEIAFGLLAGWDVEGAKINGSLYTNWIRGGPDDLVSDLAARPGARDVMFGADIATISIGPHYDPETKVMGGILHGWQFVQDESHLRRVNRFLDHVTAARAARGSAKPTKQPNLVSFSDELATKLVAGELELHQAAQRLLNAFAARNPGRRTMVYYVEVHDPTKFELPEAVLDANPLEVAVVVAPYKVPNAPWHTYGVIFAYLVTEKAPTKVAAR